MSTEVEKCTSCSECVCRSPVAEGASGSPALVVDLRQWEGPQRVCEPREHLSVFGRRSPWAGVPAGQWGQLLYLSGSRRVCVQPEAGVHIWFLQRTTRSGVW